VSTTADEDSRISFVRAPSDQVWYPQRIAYGGGCAAFVVAATRAGEKDLAGVWLGPLNGVPSRIAEQVPVTNLALGGPGLAYGVNEETPQLVIHAINGAETARHDLDDVPESVCWAPDGSLLVLLVEPGADTASLTSGKPLTTRQAPMVRSTRAPVGRRRLWRIDPATGAARPTSPSALSVWQYAPMTDGRVVAIASADPGEGGWYRSVLTVLGPDSAQRLYVPTWQISNPASSPDGTRVAFTEGWTSDRGLDTGDVRILDLATGAITEAPRIDADVTWLHWAADGRLWFAGWRGLGTAWGWFDVAVGSATVHVEAASCMNSRWHPEIVPLADGSALTVRSTEEQPPEVSVITPSGTSVAWTALNADVERERPFVVREVRWSVDEVELEGLVALPRGVDGGCPLVVDIHGGPSLAYHHDWDLTWAETITAAGYGLFLPNPYGGTGRGQDFARRNLGDPAGAEFEQIIAGVRHLVNAGTADPDRLAAMGASYGGYLTAWAVARGETFRGGIVIAGIANLTSCWGTANNAPFYEFLCLDAPNAARTLYLERSPVTVISERSLPALILHGELDQCVPVGQARELFTALSHAGVAADLVVYPGEGHQTQRIEHIRDQRERILGFLHDLFR
jgi:dipeptidyl aminopeptidase/acylaminoacyl peptidase